MYLGTLTDRVKSEALQSIKQGNHLLRSFQACCISHLPPLFQRNEDMSSFTPINIPIRRRANQASPPLHTVVSYTPRADRPSKPNVESGPGPRVNGVPEQQTSQIPELLQFPVPQLPPMPSLARLPPVAQPVIQGFQAINAGEVIDLTGLSDEEDGDDWEDVPEIIDLTNLSPEGSDSEHDGAHAEGLDSTPESYTILNLPSRRQYTLIDRPPITAPLRPRRRTRVPARSPTSARVPVRVPVRRDVCELCARVVRWGPGCLITKHHLYPQEITKKYKERYTKAQRRSIALLCRPCHDACHRTHSNRTLADFYYEIDLLKADPNIQAHISSMQRATTPELIQMHGDGVNVRGRKYRMRAARAAARAEEERKAAGRLRLTEANLRALTDPSPPGARRSARLLAKIMGGQHEGPVIVIEDDDEDEQGAVMHENSIGKENEKVQDGVNQEELVALAAHGEYIPL